MFLFILWVDWAQSGGPSATYDVGWGHWQGCTQWEVHPRWPVILQGLPRWGLDYSILVLNSGLTKEGQDRTASSWGLSLELARCHFYHILLIKASHSPAQLTGMENRSQLCGCGGVKVQEWGNGCSPLQASYPREEKSCVQCLDWLRNQEIHEMLPARHVSILKVNIAVRDY